MFILFKTKWDWCGHCALILAECVSSGAVIPPYDLNECVDCPLGGKCNGSTLTGGIMGSIWETDGGFMRVSECPAGYILVR